MLLGYLVGWLGLIDWVGSLGMGEGGRGLCSLLRIS